jgi:hypothetical protein
MPDHGFGCCDGHHEMVEAVDGDLKFGDGSEHSTFEAPVGELGEKKPSTALSHEAEVGVKRKVQRGCCASHLRTFGCLCVA